MKLRFVIEVMVMSLLALTMAGGVVFADRPMNNTHDHGGDENGDAVASIDLINCTDGAIAKWNISASNIVTFQIDDVAGVGSNVIQDVEDGVLSWNLGTNPYHLQQWDSRQSDSPDITIQLFFKIIPGSILGAAAVVCQDGSAGIQSASILLGVKGLNSLGLRNVSAHETGHALGLGHATKKGDLLDPRFERKEEGKRVVCPSNLDEDGLTATSEPVTILDSAWMELPCS